MALREEFSADELPRVKAWLERAMHDLVKYLEMMPRSLDWDNLEDEDRDILYEAILETRSERGGVLRASQVFNRTLTDLPEEVLDRWTLIMDVKKRLMVLEDLAEQLPDTPLEQLQTRDLKERIFAVGDLLRSAQKELTPSRRAR